MRCLLRRLVRHQTLYRLQHLPSPRVALDLTRTCGIWPEAR